jgi:hypothetical protein
MGEVDTAFGILLFVPLNATVTKQYTIQGVITCAASRIKTVHNTVHDAESINLRFIKHCASKQYTIQNHGREATCASSHAP